MVFYCVLCEKETCYVSKFCENCRVIKNIMNVYGYKEIRQILEKVCIRNEVQRQYKIDKEKEEKKDQTDKSYHLRSNDKGKPTKI